MVVGDEQRHCSGIHTEKTNIGRGVEHSDRVYPWETYHSIHDHLRIA